MAAPKFLARLTGRTKEVAAIESSSGAGDADKVVATGADGKIAQSLLPSGTGPAYTHAIASEALAAGALVNIWNDTSDSEAQVRNADADASKECHGYVAAAAVQGDSVIVFTEGEIVGLAGVTAGTRYYLSATAGQFTSAAPTGANVIQQFIGIGVGPSTIHFTPEPDPPIMAS